MDINEKRKTDLKSILRDIRYSRITASPASPRQCLGIVGLGVVTFIIGQKVASPAIAIPLTLFGAALGSFLGSYYSKHKTWEQRIYAKLTAYEPLDKKAYREIQSLAAEENLTFDAILDWVKHESMKLNLSTSDDNDARQRFVDKKI